jgi:hypothetical protein
MLTPAILDVFAERDDADIARTLREHQLLDTPPGDAVLAHLSNYPLNATRTRRDSVLDLLS